MAAPPTQPPKRPPVKIVPALPLIFPQSPLQRKVPAAKNEAAPKNDAVPQRKEPELEPKPELKEAKLNPKLSASAARQELEVQAVDAVSRLELNDPSETSLPKTFSIPVEGEGLTGERAVHAAFMREALEMARLALRTNETPVGCVFVREEKIIAKGMNATNVTRNGTRHAELMALSALLSYPSESQQQQQQQPLADITNKPGAASSASAPSHGEGSPESGHLYPYGQKFHPDARLDRSILSECVLYVTVEPCVMCASLLRQLGIKKVFFGAVNDKFGGTGGVFRIHLNAAPSEPSGYDKGKGSASLSEPPRERPSIDGDGGNVERGYEAEGGWGRDEAVTLLRQFYVQENNRAPVPRKKEGRAARLAAMMERDGHAGGPMIRAGSGGAGTESPDSGAAKDAE